MSGRTGRWLTAFLLTTLVLALAAVSLPAVAERFILPPLLARAGLDGGAVSVSRLGLRGCTLHLAGTGRSFPASVARIRIDWTPAGLLHRRIDRVAADSLLINLDDLPRTPSAQSGNAFSLPAALPIAVQRLEISNGLLTGSRGGNTLFLPFSLRAEQKQKEDGSAGAARDRIDSDLSLDIPGLSADLTMSLDLAGGRGTLHLDSTLDFGQPGRNFLPGLPQHLAGTCRLTADAALELAPLRVVSLEAALTSDTFSFGSGGLQVGVAPYQTFQVQVRGTGTNFHVEGEGLRLYRPVSGDAGVAADLSLENKKIRWQGDTTFAPDPAGPLPGGLALRGSSVLRFHHEGILEPGQFRLRLATPAGPPEEHPAPLLLARGAIEAQVDGLQLAGEVRGDPANPATLAGSWQAGSGRLAVRSPAGVFQTSGFSLDGETAMTDDGPRAGLHLRLDGGVFDSADTPLRVRGIHLALPLTWPPATTTERGTLRAEEVRYRETPLGRITAELHQEGDEIAVTGNLETPLFPEDRIPLDGRLHLPGGGALLADVSWSLEGGHFSGSRFVSLVPAFQAIDAEGTVGATGSLTFSSCGVEGQAEVSFSGGRIMMKEAKTSLDNITFSLRFPSLPRLVTGSAQRFFIGSVKRDRIEVSDLEGEFALEPENTLFLEKISARWAGGRLFTGPLRLQPGRERFEAALICDRLELATILSQFGLAEAGGEGRLSGRVPLTYENGKFLVDDGFLFSSPGEKGTLKIRRSEYLETSIPADVPQFSPLHFAGAALADFEYNWAKLRIRSQGENMLLQLQVDGKPREKLPFRFDSEKNAFVRLEGQGSGGIDQPVKLDVNFNVPVNEIFRFRKYMPLFRNVN
ncbi:MAG: hypothetical protein Kow0089_24620 [Desulfobulbaceae bacterium]